MKKKIEWLWDLWCISSVIGIWPRFIEPNLLSRTHLDLPIPDLSKDLIGIKILQFSDLHWSVKFSNSLLKKLIYKINDFEPDLILFTGDLLCRSKFEDRERLSHFFRSLRASTGCFAVLGNHDYEKFVTVNERGDYDLESDHSSSMIGKGFKRLFSSISLSKQMTDKVKAVYSHPQLREFFASVNFRLLENTSQLVPYKQGYINVCGLEEYTLGRLDPEKTFAHYDSKYPGLVLCHNPDAIPHLISYPGQVILCGHTHGGQVNLPWMWKKFTYLENVHFKRGIKKIGDKWVYINRGIGSVMKFRWFSLPEITFITLKQV